MRLGVVAVIGYVGSILAANWMLQHVAQGNIPPGVVPLPPFGWLAPVGVFAAGLTFTLRDVVQDELGRPAVAVAIVIGAASSYLIAPSFALASGVAFLLSEFADFAVYTPLRERSWTWAVVGSNAAGAVIDSALFLWLAFHSLAFLPGQVYGKMLMVLPVILIRHGWRAWRAEPATA